MQLQADAAGRQALVAVLLQQVAHLQPALRLGGVQHHAALGGGVVHHQLVVGAAARLGRVQALRAQAAQGGGVGVAFQLALACSAREPGRGVAGGRGGAGRHAVALGVGLTLAVVGRAEHHGAIDVAIEEGHNHLLPEAGDEHAAPVGARPGLGHAHPGARGFGRRRVAAIGRLGGVVEAVAALAAALPVELHLDAAVAVGVDGAVQADDDGRLAALAAWLRGGVSQAHGHLAALRQHVALVQRLGAVVGQALWAWARAQSLGWRCGGVGREVVARGVGHAQHGEIVIAFDAGVVGVVAQREGGAGRQGAHRAGAFELLALGFQGFEAQARVALGVCGGGMCVGAGVIREGQGVRLAVGGIDLAAGAVLAHLAVVPAGGVQRGGAEAAHATPVRDAVFLERGTGLGVAHLGLRVGREGLGVVGDDTGVAAAAFGRVLEPGKQAFFGPQAVQEGEVGFVELGAQRAAGQGAAVGHVDAPGGLQRALGLVIGEHGFGDVEHVHVLEDPGVAAVAEPVQPGVDVQAPAREAAVGAQAGHVADVAVEGAPVPRGLQLQQGGLAEQLGRVEVGAGAQGQQFDVAGGLQVRVGAGHHAFVDGGALCQQGVGPQRGVQAQQAGVLAEAAQPLAGRVGKAVQGIVQRVLDAGKIGHASVPGCVLGRGQAPPAVEPRKLAQKLACARAVPPHGGL